MESTCIKCGLKLYDYNASRISWFLRSYLTVLSVSERLFKLAFFSEEIENLNSNINVSNKHNPQKTLDNREFFREPFSVVRNNF